MIRKKDDYTVERRVIAGGVGEIEIRNRLTPDELFAKCSLCAEVTLAPGQSIGLHPHGPDAEIYYMLEGELVSLDASGGEEPFCAGDIMSTGGGQSHSVRNDSGAPARMLAIIIR